jgi:hypothetical protein
MFVRKSLDRVSPCLRDFYRHQRSHSSADEPRLFGQNSQRDRSFQGKLAPPPERQADQVRRSVRRRLDWLFVSPPISDGAPRGGLSAWHAIRAYRFFRIRRASDAAPYDVGRAYAVASISKTWRQTSTQLRFFPPHARDDAIMFRTKRSRLSLPRAVARAHCVKAIRTMLTSSIGGTVKLVTAIRPGLWPVMVDANELELALVNLAVNARDAMRNGGVIVVTAENVTLARSDTSADIAGEFVALRFTDTGSGIAPDVLPKVFDPFFTTKPVNKGSGLGLSQVHGFTHQSGGTVTIDSELGKGTTITIYLPRARDGSREVRSAGTVESAGSGRVLVVEDNPDVVEVSASMLERLRGAYCERCGCRPRSRRDARF